MNIDLGKKEKFTVSFEGADYNMSAPTVKEAQYLRNELKGNEGKENEVDVFIDFLDKLGMPKKICETLSTKQLLKLSQGILGNEQGE